MKVALWFMKLRPTWSELLASPFGLRPLAELSSNVADRMAPADRITSFGDRRFLLALLAVDDRRDAVLRIRLQPDDIRAGLQLDVRVLERGREAAAFGIHLARQRVGIGVERRPGAGQPAVDIDAERQAGGMQPDRLQRSRTLAIAGSSAPADKDISANDTARGVFIGRAAYLVELLGLEYQGSSSS
jgi:hypothetical protein